MGLALQHRARSRKPRAGLRALLGRAPEPAEVGERLSRLAPRMFKGEVVDASARRVTLALHPFAPPATLAVLPDGELELRADATMVGPGYLASVLARLAPVLDELEYVWVDGAADLRPDALRWLADELASGATRIGMPADRAFVIPDADVQTALGPRDAAWRAAVVADPACGADAFAWFDDAPGLEARSRALLAMWHEVAWREPLDDDERTVLRGVDRALRAAHDADPALALPWPEWAELLGYLRVDSERAAMVRARAGDAPSTIGYRRHAMEIELSGGWTVQLPASLVGRWEDDGARWWATDGDRMVEMTSFSVEQPLDSAALLAIAPEAHPVIERFVDGARHGRAEVSSDGKVHVLHGLVARAPHVAILTCKSHTADHAWALAAWRSLAV